MKTLTCALVLAVLLNLASAEEVWVTFINHKGNLDSGKVVEVSKDGATVQVEGQRRHVPAEDITTLDRARLGFKEEPKETFRGAQLIERLVYGVKVMNGDKVVLIRSAEMTPEERSLYNVRNPEEAARIEAEITKVHGTILPPYQRAAYNDQKHIEGQQMLARHEAREQQLRAEAEAQRVEQAAAALRAQITAQRMAHERLIALQEQQQREREIAAQERLAYEIGLIREEMETRRLLLGW